MEIRDRKAAQRRAGIMARRSLPQAERAAANAAICARLLAMPCFQKAENLLLYAAFGGEVDLAVLAEQAARLGKTVAYPVCGENFTLTAAVHGLMIIRRTRRGYAAPGEAMRARPADQKEVKSCA